MQAAKSKRTAKGRIKLSKQRPIVIITGAAGNLGQSLGTALGADYQIVGFDRRTENSNFPIIGMDLTSEPAVELALRKFGDAFGSKIASVIHLAAYFDFSGEHHDLYEKVNVEGTRKLLRALRDFDVAQFVYSSTMLVHAPCQPGEHIDENQPIEPRWAYPRSKAAAEDVVRAEHGATPYVILRLAGVYDEHVMVPTLSQQIARILERDIQSHLYSGSMLVGQSMLHREDMIRAFCRVVDRRKALPSKIELLIGEPEAMGYDALQDELGRLLHGADEWTTIRLPKAIASTRENPRLSDHS
jgi:nucleoside-diphosphate-sugar epimerase